MLLSGHNQDLPCNNTQSKDIILILFYYNYLLMSRFISMRTFTISCWVNRHTMRCTHTSGSSIIPSRTKCQIDAKLVLECEYYTIIDVRVSYIYLYNITCDSCLH